MTRTNTGLDALRSRQPKTIPPAKRPKRRPPYRRDADLLAIAEACHIIDTDPIQARLIELRRIELARQKRLQAITIAAWAIVFLLLIIAGFLGDYLYYTSRGM